MIINTRKSKLLISTSILLASYIASDCVAAENETAANVVENVATIIGTAANQQNANQASAQSGVSELPKLDDLLQTVGSNVEDTTTPVQADATAVTDTATPVVAQASESVQSASDTTAAVEAKAVATNAANQKDTEFEKKYFVTQQGTVFTPPVDIVFPTDMTEGWYYITNDINSIKSKLAGNNGVPSAPQAVAPAAIAPEQVATVAPQPAPVQQPVAQPVAAQPQAVPAPQPQESAMLQQTPVVQPQVVQPQAVPAPQPQESAMSQQTSVVQPEVAQPQAVPATEPQGSAMPQQTPVVQPEAAQQQAVPNVQQTNQEVQQHINQPGADGVKKPIMFQCYLA